MLLRLLTLDQLKSGGYGLVCGAHPSPHHGAGNSCPGLGSLGWEAMVKGLRRSRGDAAGAEPGAGPANRMTVNTGTARVRSAAVFLPGRRGRIGAMPAEGAGGAEPP